jgi:prolyl oligopeptidase
METPNSPELLGWMKQQNDFARATLARIPGRDALYTEISRDMRGTDIDGLQVAGKYRFFVRSVNGGTWKLYASTGPATTLVLDPQKGVAAGSLGAIEYFAPSRTGAYVAVGVGLNGNEPATVIHVIETATGRDLGDRITRAWGSTPIWVGDHAFFYARLPKQRPGANPVEAEERLQAFLHRVGHDPDTERPIFGYGIDRRITPLDGSYVFASAVSPYAIGVVQHGTDSNAGIYSARLSAIEAGHPSWQFLGSAYVNGGSGSLDLPGLVDIALKGDTLYTIRFDPQHRTEVTATNLRHGTFQHASVVVPPGKRVDRALSGASDGVYIWSSSGGLSQLSRLDPSTDAVQPIVFPVRGTMSEPAADPERPGVTVGITGWNQPLTYYRYDPTSRVVTETGIAAKPAGGIQSEQADEVMVTSKDGTQVPLSILHMPGIALDGSHPTLLAGYGAYGTSMEAAYFGGDNPWLRLGGIVAIAHIRGGGEFGEPWHLAGQGTQKQHSIDDFIACAQYLIAKGYTSPAKLGGAGTSAGGVTISNAIVQHPELFAAADIRAGMSGLLRSETTANGLLNVPEFGSAKTAAGFSSVYAVSAYDHIVSGTAYPAVIIETGINDTRVAPWMSAKTAARLQAATSSGKPVLLRVDYEAGHGVDATNEQEAQHLADVEAFFLWQMGEPGFQPQ